nr:aldehyde dehydrogenase family protein [Mycolicibacterium frederiksbergense]
MVSNPGIRARRHVAYLCFPSARRGDRLAALETADTGNTIGISHFDVAYGADVIDYFAGLAHESKGETSQPAEPGSLNVSVRIPYGVVGKIFPFNHPLMFTAAKMAAPLVTGNTVVIKPCEQSPLSTVAMGEIMRGSSPRCYQRRHRRRRPRR